LFTAAMTTPATHERRNVAQLCARLETKDTGRTAGVHRRALAFGSRPGEYVLIQRFSKINISLTIESIAK